MILFVLRRPHSLFWKFCEMKVWSSWLTLILLTWRIWWAPNNASKWQVGFNSAFKGLTDKNMPVKHKPCDRAFWLPTEKSTTKRLMAVISLQQHRFITCISHPDCFSVTGMLQLCKNTDEITINRSCVAPHPANCLVTDVSFYARRNRELTQTLPLFIPGCLSKGPGVA
jgi:hypothetical protein